MANKKIKNANPLLFNGITFKSKLEVGFYKTLLEAGLDVEYEPETYILWKGFKPSIPFYTMDKHTRMLKLDTKKMIDIKYTPDFRIHYKGFCIFIEAKGRENDVFYLKKKLFRNYLETQYIKKEVWTPVYFEIFTKAQLLQAIDIIKTKLL